MSVRTRDWLKFGSLVAIAFVFGLAFASTLDLPKKSGAAEPLLEAQQPARVPIPAAKPVADLGDAFVAVAERVKPAVVFIQSEKRERADAQHLPPGFDDFFPQLRRRPQIEQGTGSGFVVSSDGYILTNNHVVAGADRVNVRLYDKREFSAKVVGTDPNTDVAVVKIDATGLPTVVFGNSDSTRVGEWALAIGNPLGEAFAFTVTAGIVSAKGRQLSGLQQSRYAMQDFLQTDAAINPGNSGGPLVNIHGEVIGINSAIASETGFYAGYGFAIPINLARTVMTQLIATGHVERAVMGVSIRPITPEDAEDAKLPEIRGVVVNEFNPPDDSPAKRAGIQEGDIIVAVDGQAIESVAQLQQRVGFKKPGEVVQVTVVHDNGIRKTIPVRLAPAPSSEPQEVSDADERGSARDSGPMEEALGISVEPLSQENARDQSLRAVMRSGGALIVSQVSPDGPSYQHLVDASAGYPDIILKVNGQPTRTRAELRQVLGGVKCGMHVSLTVLSSTEDGCQQRIVRERTR